MTVAVKYKVELPCNSITITSGARYSIAIFTVDFLGQPRCVMITANTTVGP